MLKGGYWYLIEGFLSTEILEADVWIKNSPAKNARSSKVTASHIRRGRRVHSCVCVFVYVYVTIESSRGVKQKYTSQSQQSIISYITALTSQMAICGLNAVQPRVLRAECAFIFFRVSASEHLVGTGTVPNLQRRRECLNSQWKEVGKRGKRQKRSWMEKKGGITEAPHICDSYRKLLHHSDDALKKRTHTLNWNHI